MAEAIFNHKIKELKIENAFQSDSCGTGNYHIGGLADHRTIFLLKKNGVEINHVVRQLVDDDLEEFEYVVAMDKNNHSNIMRLPSANKYANKVKLMREYDPKGLGNVPDPYYGIERDFQEVFEILDRSIDSFIDELKLKRL